MLELQRGNENVPYNPRMNSYEGRVGVFSTGVAVAPAYCYLEALCQ